MTARLAFALLATLAAGWALGYTHAETALWRLRHQLERSRWFDRTADQLRKELQ